MIVFVLHLARASRARNTPARFRSRRVDTVSSRAVRSRYARSQDQLRGQGLNAEQFARRASNKLTLSYGSRATETRTLFGFHSYRTILKQGYSRFDRRRKRRNAEAGLVHGTPCPRTTLQTPVRIADDRGSRGAEVTGALIDRASRGAPLCIARRPQNASAGSAITASAPAEMRREPRAGLRHHAAP